MDDIGIQPQEGIVAKGPPVPWKLRDLGLASAWMVVAVLLVFIVLGVGIAAVGNMRDDAEIAIALGATLALEAAFLATAAWFSVRRYSCGWRALGFRPAVRGGWWVPVVVVLAAYLTLGVYFLIVELVGLGDLVPESTLPEGSFDNPAILPLLGVVAILAAPIAEESFFRGFLFPALRMQWGTFWAALASGFVFAALHFSPGSMIPFTVIGMLLAWAYVFSGSLWTAIGAHFAFNAIGFVMGLISGGGS